MPTYRFDTPDGSYEVTAPDEATAVKHFNPNLVPQYEAALGMRQTQEAVPTAQPPAARARPADDRSYLGRVVDAGIGLAEHGARGAVGALGGASGLLESAGRTLLGQRHSPAQLINQRREQAGGLIPESRGGQEIADTASMALGMAPEPVQAGLETIGELAQTELGGQVLGALDLAGAGLAGQTARHLATAGARKAGDAAGAARLAEREADRAPIDTNDPIATFRGAGYKTTSSGIRPHQKPPAGMAATESISGVSRMRGEFALENQRRSNQLAREEIGLPGHTPISEAEIEHVRKPHLAVYEELRRIPGQFRKTAEMDQAIADVDALQQRNPFLRPEPKVQALRERLREVGGFTANDMLDAVNEYRRLARNVFKATDDAVNEDLGNAYNHVADTLEEALGQVAQQSGDPRLLSRFRQARTSLAKINDVEYARVGNNVDVGRLAKRGERVPLSGRLKLMADLYPNFKDELRLGTNVNVNPPDQAGSFAPIRRIAQAGIRPVLGRPLLERYNRQLGREVEDTGPGGALGDFFEPELVGPEKPPRKLVRGDGEIDTTGMSLADELELEEPIARGVPVGTLQETGLDLMPEDVPGAEALPEPVGRPGDLTASPPGPGGSLPAQPPVVPDELVGDLVAALGLDPAAPGMNAYVPAQPRYRELGDLVLEGEEPFAPAAGMPGIDYTDPRMLPPKPGDVAAPEEFPKAKPKRKAPAQRAAPVPKVSEPVPSSPAAEPTLADELTLEPAAERPPPSELGLVPEAPAAGDDIRARFPDRTIPEDYKTIEVEDGYIAYVEPEPGVRQIKSAFVRPSQRGTGKGQELLRKAALEAEAAGETLNSDFQLSADQWRVYKKMFERGELEADYDAAKIEAAMVDSGDKARNPSGEPWIKNIRPGRGKLADEIAPEPAPAPAPKARGGFAVKPGEEVKLTETLHQELIDSEADTLDNAASAGKRALAGQLREGRLISGEGLAYLRENIDYHIDRLTDLVENGAGQNFRSALNQMKMLRDGKPKPKPTR